MLAKIKPYELAERAHEAHNSERKKYFENQRKIHHIKHNLKKALSIPIIIGVAASWLMYHRFGWPILEQTLLSWTMGGTILATIITLLQRIDERAKQ
jgi:polyferredoxin